jgi:hypothetical protein
VIVGFFISLIGLGLAYRLWNQKQPDPAPTLVAYAAE